MINPFRGQRIFIQGRIYHLVEESSIHWLEDRCTRRPVNPAQPRIYCGTANQLPPGYTRFGTPYECLRKGMGAGICEVYRKFDR